MEFYCTTKFIFDLENEDLWLHVEFWTLGGVGEHVDDKFAINTLIVKIIIINIKLIIKCIIIISDLSVTSNVLIKIVIIIIIMIAVVTIIIIINIILDLSITANDLIDISNPPSMRENADSQPLVVVHADHVDDD